MTCVLTTCCRETFQNGNTPSIEPVTLHLTDTTTWHDNMLYVSVNHNTVHHYYSRADPASFQKSTFLSHEASVYTTFLNNCGECLRFAIWIKTVAGAKQRYTVCKIPSLQQILSLQQLSFMEMTRLPWVEENMVILIFLILPDIKQCCLSSTLFQPWAMHLNIRW